MQSQGSIPGRQVPLTFMMSPWPSTKWEGLNYVMDGGVGRIGMFIKIQLKLCFVAEAGFELLYLTTPCCYHAWLKLLFIIFFS